MIQPRGNLVVLELIEAKERTQGSVVVPTQRDRICEATVIAVGPGQVVSGGGRSDTFDLREGQTVLVNHKKEGRSPVEGAVMLVPTYMPYSFGGKTYALIEQSYIFGVLSN